MKNIICFIFLISAIGARGQYDYSARCVDAHMEVNALRFQQGVNLLNEERAANRENLVPVMIEGYKDFLSILVGENEADFDSLYELRPDQYRKLRDGDPSSPWYNYSLARLNLQWAFARVKFGSYFYAARDLRKAYLLLNDNKERFPDFLPNYSGLGILHALIGSIPDNYRWVASLFSMRGSVEQGRSELKRVLEKAEEEGYPFLKDESLFFLAFIDLNLQASKEKANELLEYYGPHSDSNLMLVFSKARILMQTAHNDEAVSLLLSRPQGSEYYPFYYLDYLAGQAKLNRLDQDADRYFIRFTSNFKGASYVKSAYQRLAWSALLNGDEVKYHEYMGRVKLYGDDFTDGDKLSLKEANSGIAPNICLLKARLLYDGGYYHQADSMLDESTCQLRNEKDRIEYPYRRGRISQALGDQTTALEWYEKAISEGRESHYYFASNAALQSGLIYEAAGDYSAAGDFFRECIRLPRQEYKTSLNQKAKAGLNRIEEKQKQE